MRVLLDFREFIITPIKRILALFEDEIQIGILKSRLKEILKLERQYI